MGVPREFDKSKERGEYPSHNNRVAKRTSDKAPKPHQAIIQHYQDRCKSVKEDGEATQDVSPIVNLKRLHSSIKTWLIHLYTRVGDRVVDLACGKGGDLAKWESVDVGYYVGIDIVEGVIDIAKRRYVAMGCNFRAKFICTDCFTDTLVQERLRSEGPFSVCSCQFALHYSWSTQQRARATLANVAAMLKPGGFFIGTILDANVILKKLREASGTPISSKPATFGNKLYSITFSAENKNRALSLPLHSYSHTHNCFGIKYEFYLAGAIDHCPEWLVPLCVLAKIALEYNLELVFSTSFHQFTLQQLKQCNYQQSKTNMSPFPFATPEEWECVSLYIVFAFKKQATS